MAVGPGPSTSISAPLTLHVTVKLKGFAPLLLLKEMVPLTGDPNALAVQVSRNVVVPSTATLVEAKFPAVKPALALGGFVRVNAVVPTLRTVIVWAIGVPTEVLPK